MGKVEDMMEKHKDFFKKFHQHGLDCGNEIAQLLKSKHEDCLIVPLYRSALAIRINEDETMSIFAVGDPHCWGRDINDKNLEETEYVISGNRFGPEFFMVWGEYCLPMKADEESFFSKEREKVKWAI